MTNATATRIEEAEMRSDDRQSETRYAVHIVLSLAVKDAIRSASVKTAMHTFDSIPI